MKIHTHLVNWEKNWLHPKTIIFTLFMFFLSLAASAQQSAISGTVKDASGAPLIGVSVSIKGTTKGTMTNADGKYTIQAVPTNSILEFSYIGYTKKSLKLTNQKIADVVLMEDNKALEEVIVVGYGTQKKSDLTGSIVTVKADKMNAIPTTSVAEMLRGQAAGVAVTQNSARPGGGSDITIRGAKSISGGNGPLYVVDGVPVENIDDYNSQDIQSVEVLKDASSEAIYGARAANGVVLVTTKRGVENKTTVDFASYVGTQNMKRNFDFYSPDEWIQLKREANRTIAKNPDGTYSGTYLGGNPDANGVYPGDVSLFGNMYNNMQNRVFTDWEGLGIKPASQQKYDVSVRTGNDKTKISTSLGYFDQKGMIAPAAYQRASFRFNADQKVNKNISISVNVNYSYSDKTNEEETFSKFITESPLLNPYDASGNLVPTLEDAKYNPLWNNANQTNKTITNNFLLNGVFEWTIAKGLKYKMNASLNNITSKQGTYLTSQHEKGLSLLGVASIGTTLFTDYLLENILTYDHSFNKDNKLDITFVQSTNVRTNEVNVMTGSGFTSDELGYDFIGSAAKAYTPIHTISPDNFLSYMLRIRYNLKEKYLFSFSGRVDGASVFGANNKWGMFPAASLGWRASQEDFLKDNEWLSNLKIRLSYGSVGNKGIKPYQSQVLASSYMMQFGSGDPLVGYLPGTQLPNPSLKWETTTTLNTGVDFGFLKDRISGTIEYYHALTSNLLEKRSLASTSGYQDQLFNIGSVLNTGLEISLNLVPVKTNDFTWTNNFIYFKNKNKIQALTGAVDANGNPTNDVANGWFIGHNISAYYYQQFDGIWQLSDAPNLATSIMPTAQPGDIRVKDANQDGKIDDNDRVIMDRDPKWSGSFTSTFKWKGVDFSFDLYTVQGALKLNPYLYDANSGGNLSGKLNGLKVDYWTLENPSNSAPRPRDGTILYIQSLGYQDASYIRLRNVSLGYTFAPRMIKKLNMTNLRIYATATNFWTKTKFLSYSPEATASAYPEPKTFVCGLNVSF